MFAGGFDLHAAAQVTRTDVYELLDTLERLVDQHLVTSVDIGGERRFHVLETLRAYAVEQLVAAGNHASACDAHADWCLELVQAAAAELTGPRQGEALRRLDREHDNVVAAIGWLMSATVADQTAPDERVLRLASGMWRYWWIRGHAADGRARIERALSCAGWPPTAALADAAFAAGELAEALGDVAGARTHLERALEIRTSLDDSIGCATCRNSLGYLERAAGELDAAEQLHATALRELRAAGATRGVAIALHGLAAVAYVRGDLATASARWEETTDVVRELGDRMMLALQLSNLGMAQTANGQLDAAVVAYEQALATAREFGDVNATLFALTNLGAVLVQLGDLDAAAVLLDEALATVEPGGMLEGVTQDTYGALEARRGRPRAAAERFVAALDVFTALGDDEHVAGALEHLAGVAADVAAWDAAIGFLAAADRRRAASGSAPVGADATARTAALAAARAAMPAEQLASAAAAGSDWTTDEVRARARSFGERLPDAAPPMGRAADPLQRLGLTAREAEVARRLVDRRTDREIADELALSLRTVTTHVSAVLRKLGVSSRRDVEVALEERTRERVVLGR